MYGKRTRRSRSGRAGRDGRTWRTGRRFGRLYAVRVILLVGFAILLAWYGKQGVNNPFAVARSVRVYGDGGGYAVAAVAAEFRKDAAAVGEAAVSGGTLGDPPALDSSGAAAWKTVRPFADSGGARAVLLTYGGTTALICDTAFFASLRGGGGVQTQFREKLDILAVPASSAEELLEARNRFRPRFLVAAPPCTAAPARNVLCAQPDETGRWRLDFAVKGGKLEFGGGHPR